jgi:Probable zinc-ribbon domain
MEVRRCDPSHILSRNSSSKISVVGSMEFSDRVLTCVECGSEFAFCADEQRFFHEKKFTNTRDAV